LNGNSYFITTSLFFIAIWLIFGIFFDKGYVTITQILAGVPLSFFPDIDHNFSFLGYRNLLTHSIIIWEIIYLFNPHFIFLLIILAVGFHCLCDTLWNKKKQHGFYTIKYIGLFNEEKKRWRYKGLSGGESTFWLASNFIVAIIQFVAIVLIF